MTLGERIKKKRKEFRFTQKDLAELLKIDNTTVSKWESNTYEPDTVTLQKLADIFDTSVDYLIGRSNASNVSGLAKLKQDLIAARPICNSCGISSDEAYLEVHHLLPLSEGGNGDNPENVVVLCPNCHRKMHSEERKIIDEIKKHPIMFHDLKTNPEKKIKQIMKIWKLIKEDIDDDEDDREDIIDD